MDGDVGGNGAKCKRKKRERERERGSEKEAEGNTCREGSCHDDLRRISRAVAAASPRAAQPQHKPPCREPPSLPPFLGSPTRRVALLDLRGTRRGTGGAHCVLKTSPGHLPFAAVRAPSEVSPPKTPLPIARGAGRKVVRRFEGERVGRTSHLDSSFVARAETRTCTMAIGLSFYRSLPVPTAIKNLPRDCLPPGATD